MESFPTAAASSDPSLVELYRIFVGDLETLVSFTVPQGVVVDNKLDDDEDCVDDAVGAFVEDTLQLCFGAKDVADGLVKVDFFLSGFCMMLSRFELEA